MADVLIHIHTGPDDPIQATLGLVVATAALKNGRDTIAFLAGDTARLPDPKIIPSVEGTGTGRLKDHLAVLMENECQIFISGMSAKSCGYDDTLLSTRRASFAQPDKLVELATGATTVLCY